MFLECLERNDPQSALHIIRTRISPPHVKPLSRLLMASDLDDLMRLAAWDGCKGSSRGIVLDLLSSTPS
jgi:hypothetical protein